MVKKAVKLAINRKRLNERSSLAICISREPWRLFADFNTSGHAYSSGRGALARWPQKKIAYLYRRGFRDGGIEPLPVIRFTCERRSRFKRARIGAQERLKLCQ